MVRCTLLRYAQRVPMIKFRKGGKVYDGAAAASGAAGQNAGAAGVAQQAYASNAIEDWELPERFLRKPISPEEMDYINRGGPA